MGEMGGYFEIRTGNSAASRFSSTGLLNILLYHLVFNCIFAMDFFQHPGNFLCVLNSNICRHETTLLFKPLQSNCNYCSESELARNCRLLREGANKRGNSSRLTQSFHFFSLSRSFLP